MKIKSVCIMFVPYGTKYKSRHFIIWKKINPGSRGVQNELYRYRAHGVPPINPDVVYKKSYNNTEIHYHAIVPLLAPWMVNKADFFQSTNYLQWIPHALNPNMIW